MPCKCRGVSVHACSCGGEKMVIPSSECVANKAGPSNAYCCIHRNGKFKSTVSKVMESFYDTCAAYNIRHCPFQDFSRKGNVKSAICDLCVIACFLIANTVVFLTIMSRAILHTSSAVFSIIKWTIGKIKVEPESAPSVPSESEALENQIGLLEFNT